MEAAFRSMLVRFFALFCILALCAGSLLAQGGAGELTGQVTDPSGAVISGATVKLSNAATGDVKSTTTSSGGSYRFAAVQPGSYSLELSAKGVKSVKVQNVVVTVGAVT